MGVGIFNMSERQNNTTINRKNLWPLKSLNFFMADLEAGIGPFLGVFLLTRSWKSGLIGSVMTIGGVADMIMTILWLIFSKSIKQAC